jgi:hypothetical protein
LALEASLGDEVAVKRIKAGSTEINRLSLEVDQFDCAITEARASKKTAEDAAAAEVELSRQEQIGDALQQYYAEAVEIDDAMRLLAERFTVARQILDRAECYMNAQSACRFSN